MSAMCPQAAPFALAGGSDFLRCGSEPQADCKSHIQVEAGSHACEHERSSSSSLSKSSNSSRDSFKDVDNKAFELLRSERARSRFAMQQYNNNQSNIIGSNMAYDDSRYSFTGAAQEATFSRSCSEVTPNMMLNFGGVMDPSAGFPGLGELPSNGMEPAVEQNLTGTFTGDLNSSSAYEVGDTDHGCLLQEMLQQHPPTPSARLPDSHSQVPAAASHGDWEDSLQALQEMVHLQQQHQQAHQIYNQPQMFHSPQISSAVFNGISNKFPGVESDLLNLLQFPRVTTPSFGYPGVRGKGPLYSTSTISGPVNTDYESRSILGYDPVHSHHYQNPAQRYFHKAPEASRLQGAPIMLVDLEQERDDLSGKSFGGKREQGAASGKGEPPRGVNHFATERQRREFLNEKYHTLRSLVPNPTKADRASIVADAIEYVKDLKRRVQEFQQLVQEKRRAAGDASSVKRRRPSMDGEPYNNTVESSTGPDNNGTHLGMQQKGNDGSYSPDGSQLRCSWLQRTSQNGAHVDVRIVHDEVTIKVNQRRSKSCLLFCVIAVLQDLQLDLVHASGATMGEHDVFLFNTKILKGSTTFAGYIAVKLLEALDRHLVI